MSMPQSSGGAYGAGKAGAPFDPLEFIKKPQVILRAVSLISWQSVLFVDETAVPGENRRPLIWAIVVFGCIIAEGWHGDKCQMHGDSNACGYGTGIGILAFIICLVFLVIDALFDNISSVQYRKYVVIADLGISGLWTFLWFVGFCYMTDAWRRTNDDAPYLAPHGYGRNNIQAAIAFSFFSIITWGGLTFFAVRRYREGVSESFQEGYNPDQNASSPYSSFPGSDTGDPYQAPPFGGQKDVPEYQAPTY